MTLHEHLETRLEELETRLDDERQMFENSVPGTAPHGLHKGRVEMIEDEIDYIESLIE